MSLAAFVTGSVCSLISNLAVFCLAAVAWSHFRTRRPSLNLAVFLFLGLLITSFSVLIFGLTGILSQGWLAAIGLVVMLVMATTMRRVLASALLALVREWIESIPRSALGGVKFGIVVCVVGLMGVRMAAHVWILPPYVWDVLSYHLPKVAEWIRNGDLHIPEMTVQRSYWPAGFELLQVWWAVFWHHDFIIEAAGLPFYFLGTVSVYFVCRQIGIHRGLSTLSAFAYALTPAFLQNAVSGKNDIAISAIYLFCVALILGYRFGALDISRMMILLCAALFMGVGIKPTMVFIAPGLLFVLLLFIFSCRRNQVPLRGGIFYVFAAVLLTAAVMLGGVWYARNMALFDNPFHPTAVRVAGKVVAGSEKSSEGQQGSFSKYAIKHNMKELITKRIYDGRGPYNPDLGFMAGWGWFIFVLGVPLGTIALFKSKAYAVLLGGFTLSIVLLMGWVSEDPWNMRFVSWFPAVLCVGFAVALDGFKEASIKAGLLCLAVVCLALNFLGTINDGYRSVKDWLSIISCPIWNQTAADEVQQYCIKNIPYTEPLGYATHGNARIYPLYGPDFSRKLVNIKLELGIDFANELRKKQVNHLFLYEVDPGWTRIAVKQADDGKLENIGNGLFRISGASNQKIK